MVELYVSMSYMIVKIIIIIKVITSYIVAIQSDSMWNTSFYFNYIMGISIRSEIQFKPSSIMHIRRKKKHWEWKAPVLW